MKILIEKVIEAVRSKGSGGMDPNALISEFSSEHNTTNVIEACQLCLEQGKIFLNSDGMVQNVEV